MTNNDAQCCYRNIYKFTQSNVNIDYKTMILTNYEAHSRSVVEYVKYYYETIVDIWQNTHTTIYKI